MISKYIIYLRRLYEDSFIFIDKTLYEYIYKILLPSLIVLPTIIVLSFMLIENTMMMLSLNGLVLFLLIVAITYPLIKLKSSTQQIDIKYQRFITHITVLSLTNTDRIKIFREIADDENSYGSLSKEISNLIILIDHFNLSLDEAARQRAKETRSTILSDFYERLSYSVGSGQNISEFLIEEQKGARETYKTEYQSKLKLSETMGSFYMSIIISSIYFFVLSTLVPILMGITATLLITAAAASLITVQLIFIILLKSVSPRDKLWYFPERKTTRTEIKLYSSFAIGIILSIIIFALLILIENPINKHLYLPVSVIPLSLPAIIIHREEKKIQQVDSNFPDFIRSLGAIESVKKTSTENVLKSMKEKDFGPLTKYINRLHTRIQLNLGTKLPWKIWTEEIGSNLIQKYSEMYMKGREMGGEPKILGSTISENSKTVSNLRKEKSISANELKSRLYGITVISTIAFFVSVEILRFMLDVGNNINEDMELEAVNILSTTNYDIVFIENVMIALLFINIIIVSLTLRIFNQRSLLGTVIHVLILTPVCFVIAYYISQIIQDIL